VARLGAVRQLSGDYQNSCKEELTMKKLPAWAAVVALGAAVATTSSAFGQADLQLRQAAQREQQEKQGKREQNQGDRQERRQEKKEREQLNNMPQAARRILKAETENATNIDYYRHKEEGNNEKRVFGATFTKAGHQYDIKVDRDGNVLSRTDLTAQQATAAAPATPAPATPAPATPAPATPAPAPTSPSARAGTPSGSQEAPESGSPVYRRLQANEVPANIRTVLDREAQGGKDVKYYRSKYGQQMAYTVRWDDANGREQAAHVADNGTVLARGGHAIDDNAQPASGAQPAKGSGSATSGSNSSSGSNANANAAPGRVELNAIPRQAQTQLRRLTEGASDVKFYRTKYGNQQAYQASYTSKDGKEHRVFVDDEGKILSQRDEGSNSNAKSNSK
jgi:hypothetical protein